MHSVRGFGGGGNFRLVALLLHVILILRDLFYFHYNRTFVKYFRVKSLSYVYWTVHHCTS